MTVGPTPLQDVPRTPWNGPAIPQDASPGRAQGSVVATAGGLRAGRPAGLGLTRQHSPRGLPGQLAISLRALRAPRPLPPAAATSPATRPPHGSWPGGPPDWPPTG